MSDRHLGLAQLIGGILVIAGSLMPWGTITTGFGSVSVNGTQGDGVITLVIGIAIAIAGFLRLNSNGAAIVIAIGGLLAILTLAFGVFEIQAINGRITDRSMSIGTGLFIVMIGGVATLLGSQRGRPGIGRPG